MALLESHLEQVANSAKAIGDLEFPPPKVFTNALLGHHEITTLIRDTEPHEKSLFTIDPSASSSLHDISRRSAGTNTDALNRRKTLGQIQQRQGSVVAKVLGNDLLRQIQQSSSGYGRSRGVNVEVLLQAAEKLCSVYPIEGTRERISKVRSRHNQFRGSISQYEELVIKQQARMSRMNINNGYGNDFDEDDGDNATQIDMGENALALSEVDLRTEEDEIQELERRKKALEDRVAGMERDLGGLLR